MYLFTSLQLKQGLSDTPCLWSSWGYLEWSLTVQSLRWLHPYIWYGWKSKGLSCHLCSAKKITTFFFLVTGTKTILKKKKEMTPEGPLDACPQDHRVFLPLKHSTGQSISRTQPRCRERRNRVCLLVRCLSKSVKFLSFNRILTAPP